MDTISESAIQSPICFICACKFPYVAARKENEISWKKPFLPVSPKDKRIKSFLQKDPSDVEQMLGLDTYLENYGTIQEGKVHLDAEEHIHEFDGWLVAIPFAVGDEENTLDVNILCCPEDKRCTNSRCMAKQRRICEHCEVPICKECATVLEEPWDIFDGMHDRPPPRALCQMISCKTPKLQPEVTQRVFLCHGRVS